MELYDITGAIVSAAIKIHIDLWLGLLESVSAFLRISASPRESIRGMIMNRSKTQLTRRREEIQKRLPYGINPAWRTGVFVIFWFYSAFSASPRESIRGLMA
ncbi:MAG TPA: hypothetical protein VFR06_08815 [Gallionellaceae bacterium]|nr:hypothetical protein [Gallionellaceae bacterium]